MNQRNLGALDDLYTPRVALRLSMVAGRRFTDVAEVYFFRVVDGRITRVWGWKTPSSGCASSASTWGIEGHGAVMDAVPTSWQRPASQAARASWMSRRVRMSAAI